MEDNSSESPKKKEAASADELLAEFKAMRAASRRLRLLFTILFLIAITIPIARIVVESHQFATYRSAEVVAKAGEKMLPLSRKYSRQILGALDRIGPSVIASFMKQINQDYPRLHAKFMNEIEDVGAHATKQWPEISNHLESLIRSQEEILIENLREVIGDSMSAENLDDMIADYQKNLLGNANVYWIQVYIGHAQAVHELEQAFHMLQAKEPELQREISPLEALGIFFEFYGRELQSEAQGLLRPGGVR